MVRSKLVKDESVTLDHSTTPTLLTHYLADGAFGSGTGIVTIHNCDASSNAYVAFGSSAPASVAAMEKLTPDSSVSFSYGTGEYDTLYVAADAASVVLHVWQESGN